MENIENQNVESTITETHLDPKSVEQDLLKKEEKKFEEIDLNGVAKQFARNYPLFCAMVDNLSSNSLRRIFKVHMGIPLVDKRANLKILKEKNCFLLAEQLQNAKMTMILHTLYANNKIINDALKNEEPLQNSPEDVKLTTNEEKSS